MWICQMTGFTEQRKRFMDHIEHFLDMSRQEQMIRLRGTLPSLEEFWLYRHGASAVHVTIAVNERVLVESGRVQRLLLLSH